MYWLPSVTHLFISIVYLVYCVTFSKTTWILGLHNSSGSYYQLAQPFPRRSLPIKLPSGKMLVLMLPSYFSIDASASPPSIYPRFVRLDPRDHLWTGSTKWNIVEYWCINSSGIAPSCYAECCDCNDGGGEAKERTRMSFVETVCGILGEVYCWKTRAVACLRVFGLFYSELRCLSFGMCFWSSIESIIAKFERWYNTLSI